MKQSRIMQQLWTLLIGGCSVYLLFMVTQNQIKIFKHALFIKQSFVSVDSIVQNFFVRKLIISVVLFLLGIACYLVYLLAIEENSFLHVTRILFLSAGVLSTAWERDTIFYLNPQSRMIWIKSNSIFWIILIATCYALILKNESSVSGRIVRYLNIGNAALFIAAFGICPTSDALMIAKSYVGVTSIVAALLLIWNLAKRIGNKAYFSFLFTTIIVLMNMMFLALRRGTDVHEQSAALKRFSYMLLVVAVLLFLHQFKKYQNRIFYDKNFNRKLSEINRYKNAVVDQVTDIVQKPLEIIYGLNGMLLEKRKDTMDEEAIHILELVKNESRHAQESISYYRNNIMLLKNELNMDRMRISLQVIFEIVFDILKGEDANIKNYIRMKEVSSDIFIYGDPYFFMETHVSILRELREICGENGVITIGMSCDDRKVHLNIETSVEEVAYKKAKRFMKIFTGTQIIQGDKREELSLILARNLLISQCGRIKSIIDDGQFRMEYDIPVWKENGEEPLENYEEKSVHLQESNPIYPVIVLISTLPEQIELIKTYMMFEPYHLKVFNTGDEAQDYIDKSPLVAVVFIGTTFIKMTTDQICNRIRRNYSLGQLPIILICNHKRVITQERVLRRINDILEEPFSREEFLLKVSASLYLKKSVEDALKSRMDFLQSQMDPHFIFNTISTIMPLCLNRPEKAYDLLAYFSDYLRGNLFGDDLYKEVGIEREIDLVNAYLAIEEVRFEGLIVHSINCNCMERQVKILPLTIEPLVENSVKHGRDKNKILEIQLDIIQDDEWIYIQVQDNGLGMSPEQIRKIQNMSDEKSIGLANLRKRLMMYYREELCIQSIEGTGTTISFRIPLHSRNLAIYSDIFSGLKEKEGQQYEGDIVR